MAEVRLRLTNPGCLVVGQKLPNNAILWASGILVAEVPWPRAEAFIFSHVPKPLRGGGADLGGSTPPINISLSEAEAKQWGQ